MKMRRLVLSSAAIVSSVVTPAAFAAAFQLYELGTPIIGTAGVGQAAVASDASTAYFNPAGMSLLPGSQFMLGSQLLVPHANFARNVGATTIAGNNGGNAGSLIPGMDLYLSYALSQDWRLGISMTSPYGGMLNYNDGWVGRFVVQTETFYTINLNPSIAYRITDWVSVGVGAAIEYINMQETVALPIDPLIDGQAKLSLANIAPGFNLGVLFTPEATTKIGIAYRSRIIHHLTGNTTFLRIPDTPNTSTKMIVPQNVIASLAQDISDFTLLAELGWSGWSSMQDTVLSVDGYSATIPQGWRDTFRLGLGGKYKLTQGFAVQAGASYDSSPTNSSRRLPDLPMDRQVRVGAGITYALIRGATLGASYEYINFGQASINNTSSNGVLVGSYSRNYANVVQVSVNVDV